MPKLRVLPIVLFLFTCQVAVAQDPPKLYNGNASQSLVGWPGNVVPSELSGLFGQNKTVTPADFNNEIIRATDCNTGGPTLCNANPGQSSFGTSASGAAEEVNLWSNDDTRFIVSNEGGGYLAMQWDPAGFGSIAHMYASSYPVRGGLNMGSGSCGFSWQTAKLLYCVQGQNTAELSLRSYDLTSITVSPCSTSPCGATDGAEVENFYSDSNCPAFDGAIKVLDEPSISYDDQTFAVPVGDQTATTGRWIVVWNRVSGCRYLNVQTGAVGGAWGMTGTVGVNDRLASIHQARLLPDGVTLLFDGPCNSGDCAGSPYVKYFWNIATLSVSVCGLTVNDQYECKGHGVGGYGVYFNDLQLDSSQTACPYAQGTRSISDLKLITYLLQVRNCPRGTFDPDVHENWANNRFGNLQPVITSSHSGNSTTLPTVAWDGEIIAVVPATNSPTYRLFHTFNSNLENAQLFFDGANAIAVVSQTGKFVMWASDWNQTLGKSDGTTNACGPSTCRTDVFIGRMPLGGGIPQPPSLLRATVQ